MLNALSHRGALTATTAIAAVALGDDSCRRRGTMSVNPNILESKTAVPRHPFKRRNLIRKRIQVDEQPVAGSLEEPVIEAHRW